MIKIPTLYYRDPAEPSRVTEQVAPGCEWVIAGEGVATQKFDGVNVQATVRGEVIVSVQKRRNPTAEEKLQGLEPRYIPTNAEDPADKHILAAAAGTDTEDWPDGDWSCEAIGPKIQGGVEIRDHTFLIPFGLPMWPVNHAIFAPRGFVDLRDFLEGCAIEGIVWHHPDGRMAKIKRRDFGHRWPLRKP